MNQFIVSCVEIHLKHSTMITSFWTGSWEWYVQCFLSEWTQQHGNNIRTRRNYHLHNTCPDWLSLTVTESKCCYQKWYDWKWKLSEYCPLTSWSPHSQWTQMRVESNTICCVLCQSSGWNFSMVSLRNQ